MASGGRLLRQSAITGRMSLEDELAAFVADRKEHLANKIIPALESGAIVILDRYFYSTIAYQGARGADVASLIEQMTAFAPVPDIVFLIDVLPAVAIARIAKTRGDIPNEFEKQESLERVRDIFLRLRDRAEVAVVDGHGPECDVYHAIVRRLIDGPLKTKRCAKSYDCDVLYCTPAQVGECRWFELQGQLRR